MPEWPTITLVQAARGIALSYSGSPSEDPIVTSTMLQLVDPQEKAEEDKKALADVLRNS